MVSTYIAPDQSTLPAHERTDTLPTGIPERTLGWEALAFAATYLRHVDGKKAGQRWEFTPRQARFVLWFYAVDENGDWEYGHASRRLSKGPIAHSEMVPTPQGWKRHGDLKVWDEVYAVDGSVTRVLELGDEVNEDCYKLTWEDGSTVKCTGSHRWPLEDGRIMTVEEMNLSAGPLMSRSVPGISESRDLTRIEPIAPEPARCITVAHPEHQYLVGEGWVPTCNSGKSPFAAVMAIIELLAPVRFSHFDESLPGKCVGKRVDMPWVQLVAASTSQTENTMQMVRAMLSPHNAPKLHEDFELEIGKTMVNVAPAGKLEILSSAARSAEGARCTCVVADELEHWTPAQGGVELFGTLKANLTKTGNRMLETLNAWVPDVGSAGELTFKAWCAQEDGDERQISRGILYDAVVAPPGTDISNEESLKDALEYVYADCPWSLEHLDAIISDIYTSSTSLEASKRKYLNEPTAAEDAWCDPKQWALLAKRDRVVKPGEEIVAFFDGSRSDDDTALVGCCVSDGHVFLIGHWQGRKKGKRHVIDQRVVDAAVGRMFDKYSVQAFFCDLREYEGYIKSIWPEKYGDRVAIWASPRGEVPEVFSWDMRGKLKDFTLACELAEAEIQEGLFTHDGSAVLANHVANARRYENRWGISIAKESKDSPNKIDAAVCMIGARHALRVLKENAEAPRSFEAFFL